MKRVIVLTVLCFERWPNTSIVILLQEWHRVGANISHNDVLARSNVGQVPVIPSVYMNQPTVPTIRKEPIVTMVYEKTSIVLDVY